MNATQTNPLLNPKVFGLAELAKTPESDLTLVGYKGVLYLRNKRTGAYLADEREDRRVDMTLEKDRTETARPFGTEDQLADFFARVRKTMKLNLSFSRLPLVLLLAKVQVPEKVFGGIGGRSAAALAC